MTNEEIIKGLQAVNEHIGKHFNEGGAWMAEFIDNAIKALEQQRWIPVSERLPEEDEWVLITFDDGIEIASLDDDGWCYSSVGNDDWIAEHPPVAWMPLPQPYKAESEDKGWVKSK